MPVSKKIKLMDKKVEQTKAQYNLNRETAMISALSSGNVGKYEFWIGEDVLLKEERIIRKSCSNQKA